MKHLTILVDMDDTIESLASAWVDYLNARHGTTTKLTDITGWDISKAFPTLTNEQVYAPLFEDGTHNLEGGNYFKILMTAQHNKKYDAEANGMLRVETWAEVYSAITLLAEEDDLKGWKEVPMAITLYSTGCPKCKVLKKKLEEKGIKYTENNSVDEMLSLGISQVPVLSVNNKLLDFSTANDWVNQQ